MTTEIHLALSNTFLSSVHKLSAADGQRAIGAIEKFRSNPDMPGLNLEAMKFDPSLMTIRASRSIRIALSRRGSTYVALFTGQHDEVYKRLENGRFIVNDATQRIGFIEIGQTYAGLTTTRLDSSVRPLENWTDEQLTSIGFDANEVATLRSLECEEEILDLIGNGWGEDRVDEVLTLLETTYQDYVNRSLLDDGEVDRENHLQRAIARYGAVAGLSPLLGEEEVARIARAPIEEWMLFLHPDQREVADKVYSGPARVRGSAGTGKTVVLLHRAATLARRYEATLAEAPILVTTYISNLPPILATLYQQLPLGPKEGVEFTNIDKLARKICNDAGQSASVSPRLVDAAFASAWNVVVKPETAIHRSQLSRSYMRDELEKVIKGRDITALDEYLEVRRVGRSTQFAGPLRKQTWDLLLEWDRQMAQRETSCFADIVNRAKRIAQNFQTPIYRSALIDEAQDLSQSGLELVAALVNSREQPREDELFIAGDGAQRIYPGGFTLLQANVDVRGRTTVLRRGYRTTQAIADAAAKVAGGILVEDLDEDFFHEIQADVAPQQGDPVLIHELSSQDTWHENLKGLIATIRERGEGVSLGDIGILTPTNRVSDSIAEACRKALLPFIRLQEYDGSASDALKIGTFHRAKGLEFKAVIIADLSQGFVPRRTLDEIPPQELEDHRRLELSALFVAMMRARDLLILCHSGEPSSFLDPILDSCQKV